MPQWPGRGQLDTINFDDIYYYISLLTPTRRLNPGMTCPKIFAKPLTGWASPKPSRSFWPAWAPIRGEVVYHSIIEDLEKKGVIFLDMDAALREYPEIVKEYFGTVIPPEDNKFAALNTAVWSGGSFIYVPPGVHVDLPLQAYFRINAQNMGQFERTLIIVDEGAYVHYVEGCTAPTYSTDSLHSAVVEIIVKDNARCRYSTSQNWSHNV
jgi:Fe-S cluster assembly protein SufB